MLDKIQLMGQKIQTLGNWISEMRTLSSNPYTNGLNVERMLRDLEGFANDLGKDVRSLEDELEISNITEEENQAE